MPQCEKDENPGQGVLLARTKGTSKGVPVFGLARPLCYKSLIENML